MKRKIGIVVIVVVIVLLAVSWYGRYRYNIDREKIDMVTNQSGSQTETDAPAAAEQASKERAAQAAMERAAAEAAAKQAAAESEGTP